nr:hypothetical protein [Kitasatospora sp. MMS16-BH015]
MSEPWSETPAVPRETPGVLPAPTAAPKSLLEQMQDLLNSVNADLAGLDADLQSSGTRAVEGRGQADSSAGPATSGW